MRRRQSNFNITVVFADGTSMPEEQFMREGRVINAEDNMELQLEARRLFHPEYAEEAKKIAKYENTERRRRELMAELAELT